MMAAMALADVIVLATNEKSSLENVRQ